MQNGSMQHNAELTLTVGHASDAGLRRSENEDALGYRLPADSPVSQARGALFVVCDGIGGLHDGQKASRMAVREFIQVYYDAPGADTDQWLRAATRRANALIYHTGRRVARAGGMGTTLVCAAVLGANAWFLNIGDSRAYLWRQGQLHQLSQDHIPQRRGAKDRRIDRALGTDRQVAPFIRGPVVLCSGDRFLLCTDGLTTAVAEPAIAAMLQGFPPAEAARQLIERAKTAGATDNVSTLVVGAETLAHPDASAVRAETSASSHWQETPWRSSRLERPWAAVLRLMHDPARSRRWAPWLYAGLVILVLLAGLIVGWLLGH